MRLIRATVEIPSTVPSLELRPRQSLPIKKAKRDDITKQMRFIPTAFQGFYLTLKAGNMEDDKDQPQEDQPQEDQPQEDQPLGDQPHEDQPQENSAEVDVFTFLRCLCH